MNGSEDFGEPAEGSDLTPKQEAAIVALLASPSAEAAAASCGVSAGTLRRWMKEEAFQDAWRAARLNVLDAATMKLRQAAGDAVDTLTRNLSCGNAPSEIRAATAILDMAYKSAELEDLAERIETLESLLIDKPAGAGGRALP